MDKLEANTKTIIVDFQYLIECPYCKQYTRMWNCNEEMICRTCKEVFWIPNGILPETE